MISVSSSCIPAPTIRQAVETLARAGFHNIELSGGTRHYEGLTDDLLELRERFGLHYLVHNYFPPPEEDFVLNLASLNDEIFAKTMAHLEKALELSVLLGADRYGFHAGFFVDRPVSEIGKVFGRSRLYDRDRAMARFHEGYALLQEKFPTVRIYVENNCYSWSNFQVYGQDRPFMLLDYQDYTQLRTATGCPCLLDLAHLQVSAATLNIDFTEELDLFLPETDYLHVSDNDGLHDQNTPLRADGLLMRTLEGRLLQGKLITLEVYDCLDKIRESYRLLDGLASRTAEHRDCA
jgi:sugar phosphate isomerase/epimerase